jgi:tRNA A37 methylthiotransferase MiaB
MRTVQWVICISICSQVVLSVPQSQVVLSILRDAGYDQTDAMTDADVVLVNTCAIREGVYTNTRMECVLMFHHARA